MKQTYLILIFLALSLDGFSQKYYRCNADHVAVRVAPGDSSDIFYIATPYYNCEVGDVYIDKGFVFMSRDAKEDGYTKIYNLYNTICWDEGWIPSKCLSPAKKCPSCKGSGTTGEKCEVCDGAGDWGCCQYKGTKVCERCKGIGYY